MLCGREIADGAESLYCRHCNAVFHRSCIIEHFYYNRFCPVCKEKISFVDMRYGEPSRLPPEGLRDIHSELIPPGEYIPQQVRTPQWSPQQEVASYGVHHVVRRGAYRFRRKGLRARIQEFVSTRPEERSASALGRFRQNKKGMVGVYMLVASILIGVLAPYLILYDPVVYLAEDEAFVNHPPTWKYPLGTDVFGRDIYSQTVWGFRSALMIALPSALLIGAIGTVVGLVSGYYGRYVDAILQRVSLTFLVWPSIPLIALIVFSWGGYMAQYAVVAGVSFTLWPTSARAIRAEVKSLKTRTFIESAKISGASSTRIIFRHILPNIIHITFLYMTIAVASALVLEATFNFLGLTSPAVITWGQMLSFTYHSATARYGVGGGVSWWSIVPPGLAIAYMVLSFFLISTGLRESMRIALVRF
jgi:peptide/nickel transport system permease protein